MSYVYIRSEPGLWTVGHYAPGGKWHPESDHANESAAAERAAWLNGAATASAAAMADAAAIAELTGAARFVEQQLRDLGRPGGLGQDLTQTLSRLAAMLTRALATAERRVA